MTRKGLHSFHIPVLGLAYSIDTPVKVARFGIDSAISIIDDQLLEDVRKHYCAKTGAVYQAISIREEDYRARRITAYLDLVGTIVAAQTERLRKLPFAGGNELVRYFEMLPGDAFSRQTYNIMKELPEGKEKQRLQQELRLSIAPGAIDVNIMSKVDKARLDADGNELPKAYSDAHAALRGYARSSLSSSLIFSAGYNPSLYAYTEQFPDFYPDTKGRLKKKIILKVSDFRSALVQGKILAKKGLWVSEFRIESGLNCGGHAFATEGLLLGPILEIFLQKRTELYNELFDLCSAAHIEKNIHSFIDRPVMKITVQGGIGTAHEDRFLLEHYALDGTGWGSPFLLVPEATNVDPATLQDLAAAKPEDYFLSNASPLGIPFNNFRKSSAEQQRLERIVKGRPGSPCHKKFLAADTEFTTAPICTASRKYQYLKIQQLKEKGLPTALYDIAYQAITDKDCLCEGLGAAVRITEHIPLSHRLAAVTICPGPNLAYFSGVFSLQDMTDHIYGRKNLLNSIYRPNMFINELHLYINHFKKKTEAITERSSKHVKGLNTFKANLLEGIAYYKNLLSYLKNETGTYKATMKEELMLAEATITDIAIPAPFSI